MLRRTIEAALNGQSREVLLNASELARRVVRDLAEGKLLIFLGAGASLGGVAEHASGERAPTSKELMTAIGERFGVAVTGESTLAGVASVAAQQSGEGSVKGHVAEIIRSKCRKPLRAHRALARILPKIVVSTNYDDLYERALDEQGTSVTKVVRPNDIPQVTDQRPTLVKLHGDVHSTDMMVLTKQDYRRWEDKAQSLVTQMLADLQRYAVVFVGYSLNDPNLERLLGLVESRLGIWGPKRYALVHSVNDEARAGWSDLVAFVEGDATEFLEELADLREQGEGGPGGTAPSVVPPSADPSAGLQKLREQIQDGDMDGALESCDAIERELRAVGALNTAATAWLELATAAMDWGTFRTCMLAYTRAGSLFLEARTASRGPALGCGSPRAGW
jgi:hypothetical protein